ncbi:MAG: MFS transporter [Chloroflexi bacterium]|nr:MFS transporter [Chloroflexota bacterium]
MQLLVTSGDVIKAMVGKVFYGWWIVYCGSAIMAVSAGINFYGFSAFFVPLAQDFGWKRSVLSGVFSLSRLEGGILGPVEGLLIDKFGPRRMMLLGVPLMGIGFLFFSRVDSLFSLYLIYIFLITLGSSLGTFSPVGAAVANWFIRKRSLALGITQAGVAVGGAVFLPVLGWLISAYGWRTAAVVAGLVILGIGLPITLVMRHKPEQYGLLPDGASAHQARGVAGDSLDEVSLTAWQSLRTRALWFLGFSLTLRSLVTTGLTIHFVAMMVDRDFSLTVASSLLGSVALLSIVGRLGMAWLGDYLDKRYLLAGSLGLMALSMLAMGLAESQWLVGAILVVYAVAYGGAIVLPIALQAEYFGRGSFAAIRGLLSSLQTPGMLVGPIFAGFVYDVTESYFVAFMGFAVAGLLGALLLLGVKKPGDRNPVSVPLMS